MTTASARYIVIRSASSRSPYAVWDTHRRINVGHFDTEKFALRMAAKSNVVVR